MNGLRLLPRTHTPGTSIYSGVTVCLVGLFHGPGSAAHIERSTKLLAEMTARDRLAQ